MSVCEYIWMCVCYIINIYPREMICWIRTIKINSTGMIHDLSPGTNFDSAYPANHLYGINLWGCVV